MKRTKLDWIDQQNDMWKEQGQEYRMCPCCRDIVLHMLLTKLSIFENIYICRYCEKMERAMPSFNWIKVNELHREVFRSGVFGDG